MSQSREKSRRAPLAIIAAAAALALPATQAAAAPATKEYVPAVPKAGKKGGEQPSAAAGALTEQQQVEEVTTSPELGAPTAEQMIAAETSDGDNEGGSFPVEVYLLAAVLLGITATALWARRRSLLPR